MGSAIFTIVFVVLVAVALNATQRNGSCEPSQAVGRSPLMSQARLNLLDRRIVEHLSAYSGLQVLLELGLPFDTLRGSREIMQDARSIAADISLIPGFKSIEPLRLHGTH